jgi:DNA-binding GntR family transcriptional regulator
MPSSDAYSKLREAILTGRYLPNERLVEADLVAALGESRAAVRTAIVRLEGDGLVEHSPNRGAKVRLVGEAEAGEILEARAVLEGFGASKAAHNATPEDVGGLRALLAEMAARHASGDLIGASETNARLHAAILSLAGHATTQRLVASLNSQLVRYQYRTIFVPGRPAQSLAEHTAIVDAIAAGDGEAAERAMRTHLTNVSGALRRLPGAADAA